MFEISVTSFGLCNALATFERLMEIVIACLHWEIFLLKPRSRHYNRKSLEDMLQNLGRPFKRLQKARRCNLLAKEAEFIGHIISESRMKTDLNKTKSVETWSTPKNIKRPERFCGSV